jgi:hypothetical protein
VDVPTDLLTMISTTPTFCPRKEKLI